MSNVTSILNSLPRTNKGCPRHGMADLKVIQRKCNHSAFNGYRYAPSDYSSVRCFAADCTFAIRTKASYVDGLPDATDADMGIKPDPEVLASYSRTMERRP